MLVLWGAWIIGGGRRNESLPDLSICPAGGAAFIVLCTAGTLLGALSGLRAVLGTVRRE
jgi:hypothetical protein